MRYLRFDIHPHRFAYIWWDQDKTKQFLIVWIHDVNGNVDIYSGTAEDYPDYISATYMVGSDPSVGGAFAKSMLTEISEKEFLIAIGAI